MNLFGDNLPEPTPEQLAAATRSASIAYTVAVEALQDAAEVFAARGETATAIAMTLLALRLIAEAQREGVPSASDEDLSPPPGHNLN